MPTKWACPVRGKENRNGIDHNNDDVQPRRSTLDRSIAMRLASTEYDRYLEMMRMLSPADWTGPTECAGWDVRTMATHVLGMAEMAASIRENLRQNLAARRRGGLFIDALTGLQVDERASLRPDEIVGRFARVAPKAGKGRRRTPALIWRRTLPVAQLVSGMDEAWTVGYLIDTILTRDTWMHRVDTARATGRDVILTPDHDGVLIGMSPPSGRAGTASPSPCA